MKSSLGGIIALLSVALYLGAAIYASAQDFSIKRLRAVEKCWADHPGTVMDYFRRQACNDTQKAIIDKEERTAREERAAAERELRARDCIANNLANVENRITATADKLNAQTTFDAALFVLKADFANQVSLDRRPDDIEKRFAYLYTSVPCDTAFYFRLAIAEGNDKLVAYFNVWALNAPQGYPTEYGLVKKLTRKFESE